MVFKFLSSLIFTTVLLYAQSSKMDFEVSGFVTAGGVYNDNKEIIFIDNKDDVKGSKGDWASSTDTKIGLQFDGYLTDVLSVTLQGITNQIDEDGGNSFIEWANIKYNISDDVSIRLGKMRAPISLYSDVLNVSYAYPWVRLPREVYSVLPFSNYNGAELSYNFYVNEYDVSMYLLYGNNKKNVTIPSSSKVSTDTYLDELKGIVFNTNVDNLTLRASYFCMEMQSIKTTIVNPTTTLVEHIDKKMQFISTSAMYQFEKAFIVGAYVYNAVKNVQAGFQSYYIAAGYHLGKWTPYGIFAKRTPQSKPTINVTNIGLSSLLNTEKNGYSIGVRYDFMPGGAIKSQYDYVDNYVLSESEFDSTKQNVYTLSLDFVF